MNSAEKEIAAFASMTMGSFGIVVDIPGVVHDVGERDFAGAGIGATAVAGNVTQMLGGARRSGLAGRALALLKTAPVFGNLYTIGKVTGPAHVNYDRSLHAGLRKLHAAAQQEYISKIELFGSTEDIIDMGNKFKELGCAKILGDGN